MAPQLSMYIFGIFCDEKIIGALYFLQSRMVPCIAAVGDNLF